MKKMLSVFLFFILANSCSVKMVPVDIVDYWDYTPLTSRGIFVTESNSVNFNYVALGSIYIELREGKKNNNNSPLNVSVPYDRDIKPSNEGNDIVKAPNITIVTANIDDVLSKLHSQLVAVGANGIINLHITRLQSEELGSRLILGPGYAITGMAIKK